MNVKSDVLNYFKLKHRFCFSEIGKIDAEWTNEAEVVCVYYEGARLFIAKRTKKEKP